MLPAPIIRNKYLDRINSTHCFLFPALTNALANVFNFVQRLINQAFAITLELIEQMLWNRPTEGR